MFSAGYLQKCTNKRFCRKNEWFSTADLNGSISEDGNHSTSFSHCNAWYFSYFQWWLQLYFLQKMGSCEHVSRSTYKPNASHHVINQGTMGLRSKGDFFNYETIRLCTVVPKNRFIFHEILVINETDLPLIFFSISQMFHQCGGTCSLPWCLRVRNKLANYRREWYVVCDWWEPKGAMYGYKAFRYISSSQRDLWWVLGSLSLSIWLPLTNSAQCRLCERIITKLFHRCLNFIVILWVHVILALLYLDIRAKHIASKMNPFLSLEICLPIDDTQASS